MKRRKNGRTFRVRPSRPASPLAFILALIMLIALGVTAWFLDGREIRLTEETETQSAAPAPLPTPSAIPTETPTDVTPEPTTEAQEDGAGVSVPANPMGWTPFSVAYAENGPEETPAPTPEPTDALPPAPTDEPEPTYVPAHEAYLTREAFVPGALSGVKIGIDPGHQSHGNSAQEPVSPTSSETKAKVSSGTAGVRTGRDEYAVVLEIGLQLRDALMAEGADVLMTREINDVDISNIERAQMMNEWGADVVLRLHLNGTDNQSVNGIGLFVKSYGEGAAESRAICDPLLLAMGQATGARTENVHVSDYYSGLNWSTVPSILVEMGYMSNPDEDEKLCSPEYQALLVKGMVDGLKAYFGE